MSHYLAGLLARDHAFRRRESGQEVDKAEAQCCLVSEGLVGILPGGITLIFILESCSTSIYMISVMTDPPNISLRVFS